MFSWLKKIFKRYDSLNPIWGIRLSSHDGIDTDRNVLTIFLGYYIRSFTLPFSLVKPIVDYYVYKKDGNGKDMADIMATAYAVNVYGITYLPDLGYFEFNWNYGDDLYTNVNKHKGTMKLIHLFWHYTTKMNTTLLNLDSTPFSDITKSSEDNIKYLKEIQPRYYVKVSGRDGRVYVMECSYSLDVYTYGGSLFTKFIMTMFKKPYSVRRLNIEIPNLHYSATLSMEDDEIPVDAIKRFCTLNKYQFIIIIEKG